ncbi:serine/threonine protein kinase [Capronia epimyces CBS 606.96]|uniref:non-specific serine/threonine protein kinase n=1 Tax=Capronia epimyces CBS 606.96 TaxID=1182542 RepID=W9Y838_9EURO|nr:serine/threonine protein kinase [Capronia epimyces CBS 606.96]EXJ89007.1 serine/threonine protein kinase [Capronia epimyces CBS 606.96]
MSSASTWPTVLSDLASSDGSTNIPDEGRFHREFKAACGRIREKDPERLLARFLRHHDQIIAFVSAIDESASLDNVPHCLSSVFWSKAFETVEKALKTRQKDKFFRDHLPKLQDVIPAFGAQLPLFPDNETVQKPLQNIFAQYMGCYDMVLQLLDPQQPDVDEEAFLARTKSATTAIQALKEEWEDSVKQAIEEQAAARNTNTQVSYYNATDGPYYPYTARVLFEFQESLGAGTYGQVHKVREPSTGTFYAQKVIRISEPPMRSKAQVEKEVHNEVSIMQKLRHHHIASVQFHYFDAEKNTYNLIMLPVAECDLRRFLHDCAQQGFPKTELMHLTSWFGCLVGALDFAHSKHVKHEDIKPSNILIKDHQVYLADFGCAKDFEGLDNSNSIDTITFGTPVYSAPESKPRGRRADVFSLGCVFTEMLTVKYKHTLEEFRAHRCLTHGDYPYAFRESLPKVKEWINWIVPAADSVGKLLKEQTFLMLQRNPDRRSEAKDVKRSLRPEGEDVFCNSCF